MSKPSEWSPFQSLLSSPKTQQLPKGQSAVSSFAFLLAACLILEFLYADAYVGFFESATIEGIPSPASAAAALTSALMSFLLLEIMQWLMDHHRADSEGTVLCQPRLLTISSYHVMVSTCCTLVLLVRLFPMQHWLQNVLCPITHWVILVYACSFFRERPPGIVPTGSTGARLQNEMAQPGSTSAKACDLVEKNLVSFYNKGDKGELVFIGTGFIVQVDKDRYLVTAHHVYQDAFLVGRPHDSSSLVDYMAEVEKGNFSPFISIRYDYVMLKIAPSLHSRFGAGFKHMVPRYSYSEIFVPAILNDGRTLSYKGRSFTYYEKVHSPKPLRHTATTYKGCSGGPVLVYGNGKYQVIGIHLGADDLVGHNFGVYFGLVHMSDDVENIERLSDKFFESAVPKDRRGKVYYASDEEAAELRSDDEPIMGDEWYDIYPDSRQQTFIAVRKGKGGKKTQRRFSDQENFESTRAKVVPTEPTEQPKTAKKAKKATEPTLQQTVKRLVVESTVDKAEPQPVKKEPLKDQAAGATTISPKTSGNTKEDKVLISLAEQLFSGAVTPHQFRSLLAGLISASARVEESTKTLNLSQAAKSPKKQRKSLRK